MQPVTNSRYSNSTEEQIAIVVLAEKILFSIIIFFGSKWQILITDENFSWLKVTKFWLVYKNYD